MEVRCLQPPQRGGYVTITQGWATEAPCGIVARGKGQAGHQQCPREPRLKQQGAGGWDGGAGGEKAQKEGLYVYIELVHVVQQKLTHIVKQLYSNLKEKKKAFNSMIVCSLPR